MMQEKEKERYLRQMAVKEWGEKGQEAMKKSTFLIIGAGGLGCPAAQTLAASGAGRLLLVDGDVVETNNLSRQFLHTAERLGMNKAESAALALRALNPYVQIEPIPRRVDEEALRPLVRRADVVLDCCDNSATRHAVNRVCHDERKPLVTAGCIRAMGQISVFDFRTQSEPCYACSFPKDSEQDLKASSLGVLTILTTLMGTLEAAEAAKLVTGAGSVLTSRLLLVDLLHGDFQTLALTPDPDCLVCGRRRSSSAGLS
ncbi:MAG: HesA/MoeB/ThiF family protein [Mesosutterella sp.]|nr:HesA/MoeB/ThiF family protein [Mesosutterella sp.]